MTSFLKDRYKICLITLHIVPILKAVKHKNSSQETIFTSLLP